MATREVRTGELLDKIFAGKTGIKKYLVILYGAPGSGKSSLREVVLREKGILPHNCVSMDIDALVMMDAEFRNTERRNMSQDEKDALYRTLRRKVDHVAEIVRHRVIASSMHLTIETTGQQIGWTVAKIMEMRSHGYSVVVVYPVVKEETAIRRVATREEATGQIAASASVIKKSMANAAGNAIKLMEYIDEMYVYDNETMPGVSFLEIRIETHRWAEENTCDVERGRDWQHAQFTDTQTSRTMRVKINCRQAATLSAPLKEFMRGLQEKVSCELCGPS